MTKNRSKKHLHSGPPATLLQVDDKRMNSALMRLTIAACRVFDRPIISMFTIKIIKEIKALRRLPIREVD